MIYPFVCVAITQAYFQIESGEDAQEEFGWKLVHGDVFRPPRKGMLLSVLLGSGVQVFFMTLVTLGRSLFEFMLIILFPLTYISCVDGK